MSAPFATSRKPLFRAPVCYYRHHKALHQSARIARGSAPPNFRGRHAGKQAPLFFEPFHDSLPAHGCRAWGRPGARPRRRRRSGVRPQRLQTRRRTFRKIEGATLALTWRGERGTDLRLGLGIDNGHPIVAEMAVRPKGGAWSTLAGNLSPEFHVTSGLRRISEQQLRPLRALGVDITPEIIEKEKWVVFWDSPLTVPGLEGTNPGLPRSADEIQRATSSFQTTGCSVKTDGARLEVSFPGLSLVFLTAACNTRSIRDRPRPSGSHCQD